MDEANFNGVNAIFIMGDQLERANGFGNEYLFRTACGDFLGDKTYKQGDQEFTDIITSLEQQPELLPKDNYVFAVERDETGYAIEMDGPFRHSGQKKFRYHHDFVENGRPIFHYNQTPEEYDGMFDLRIEHKPPSGTYVTENSWPAGSAYPDSFIIGDPHLNFYEGTAIIDDIKLYVLKEDAEKAAADEG